jgi:hypothetical protein
MVMRVPTLTAPEELTDLIDRQWERMRHPGTWFTGEERVALAASARGDQNDDAPAHEAARAIHDHPAEITREWLSTLEDRGLTPAEYVEVLGIVAQLRAIDTFLFGLGGGQRPLPDPADGQPTRVVVDDTTIDGGWVPTVGPAFPPSVLSSVAAENEAMHDLHENFYLAPAAGEGYTMANLHAVRDGLSRSQMEFVAARTSLINDCFF